MLRERRTIIDPTVVPFATMFVGRPGVMDPGAAEVADRLPPLVRRGFVSGGLPWVRINDMMPGVQYSVVSFGPRLLDREPNIGERVTIAHLEAMRMYNEGKTERTLKIMASALGVKPDELREICWPRMREDGMIDTASLIDFQKWALARGELERVVPASQFWDSRFVEAANRALSQAR